MARRGARHLAIDLPGPAGRTRRRSSSIGTYGLAGSAVSRFSVSLEDWGNPLVTAFANRKEFFFPRAAFRRRSQAAPGDAVRRLGVSRAAARRLRLLRGRVRPAAARRQRAVPSGAALVHERLQPEARSDPPAAGAGRRRPQAGTRTLAALQHHQRRHRSDSADRRRRAAADRQRARADAVHRVGGRKRRPPRRRPHEQHAAVVGAVEQGDRGDRRDPPRAAAGQPGRRLGPGVRAAQHGHRGCAPGQRRRLDSAQRHRPAPRQRGDRGELPQDAHRRGAGARRERSPEPDHRLGGRPDRRDRRRPARPR